MLALCLCAVYLLPLVRVARAQQSQALLRDFPVLFPRFNQKGLKADYVIVIDRSSSMSGYWKTVAEGLGEFVDAVQDGDRVSVVTFGNQKAGDHEAAQAVGCYRELPMPTRVIDSPQAREILKKDIGDICTPDGSKTDIGEALKKALDALNAPGGNTLKLVFFFTDFIHEPPDKSPYYGMGQGTEEVWKKLETRRKNEQTGNAVYSYALLLETGTSTGRDLRLAKAVFSDLEPVRLNSRTLRSYMALIRDSLLRDRLKTLVNDEAMRSEVTLAEVRRKENELVAVLEFKRGEFLTTKSISGVKVLELELGALGSRLTPMSQEGKEYLVDADSGRVEVPIATVNDSDSLIDRFLAWEVTATLPLKLEGRRTFEPVAEVAKLNLPPEAQEFRTAGRPVVALSGGMFSPFTLGALAALALIAFLLLRRRYRKRFIVGTFTVRDSRQRSVGAASFKDANRQADFLVGDLGAKGGGGIRVEGADWRLRFFAVSPRPFGAPSGLYMLVEEGEARPSMNGVELPLMNSYAPRKRLSRGVVVVKVGQHTLTYEPS